jgi:hypothetical protein
MRAYLVIVFHVRQQHVTKMSFAQDDDMIDAFPADRGVCTSARPYILAPSSPMLADDVQRDLEIGERASPGTSLPPVSIPIRFTAMTCFSRASLSILIGAPDEPHLTNSFARWE